MKRETIGLPDWMPVLSRGRHRSAKQGACFMEYASVLAGERWSDHPACTHPAVASLARLVNDCMDDAYRSDLAPLVASVVGLAGRGALTTVLVSVHAASAALPVASEVRQRALSAGILRCLELVDDVDDPQVLRIAADARHALETTPVAAAWAQEFLRDGGRFPMKALDRMCEAILRTSVVGIAEACVTDPDSRLYDLLVGAITEFGETMADASAPASLPARSLQHA